MNRFDMIKKHKISFSGGKDSSAMLLRMLELGMPVDEVLFCDTGKEFPQLYAYVDRMKKHVEGLGIKFTTLYPKKTWDDWFFGNITRGKMVGQPRGWPLMFFHCYWSREAKFIPLNKECDGHERYIGFAADETKRVTAGLKKEGYNFPLYDWGWKEADALKYLEQIGWCEQFHRDFNRTGCFLCPKQGMKSLEMLCLKYPDQWEELMWYAERANNDFKPGITYEVLIDIQKRVRTNPNYVPTGSNCGGCVAEF